eukprot:TRINITY_DN95182_c0_g1_i1.p1 TRINITY_DN95182_c0_g1~~TRINITY_DN95182_c0_g1_i1.p1  ORF type:complete len:297 (-),score=41.20 TRINITY_DN95182_c0_g1_i1:236-1042(-)
MDVYRRQRELKLWDQSVLEDKTALILGVGGLGTNISMDCLRLGFKKIILVDMDVVDTHNLNRQILFNEKDVGVSKTKAARDALNKLHRTRENQEIDIIDMNVVTEWQKLKPYLEAADVIWNTVDYGDYFHAAICLAAKHLKKPIVTGGTEPYYGHTVVLFFQPPGGCDYHKIHELADKKVLARMESPELLNEKDLNFLPADEMLPTGGSTVYTAGTCSHLMVSLLVNWLLHCAFPEERPKPPTKTVFNMMAFDVEKWDMDVEGNLTQN